MFGKNYNKPGKGIPKDEPKKKGIALFFDIFVREFWNLVGLNLIFIITSIPIFTIGASYSALNSVIIKMFRDISIDVIPDYKQAFKENFKQGTIASIINITIIVAVFFSYNFYYHFNEFIAYIVLGISFIIIMIFTYVFPLIASVDLSIKNIYKNSMILGSVCLKQSVLALLFTIVSNFIALILPPVAITLALFIGFSFFAFTNGFLAYKGIIKYIIAPNHE